MLQDSRNAQLFNGHRASGATAPSSSAQASEFTKKLEHNIRRAEHAGRPHTEHFDLRPADAAILLSMSRGNRALKPWRVRDYRDAYHAGEFSDTGQGLAITETRALANGHHRMTGLSQCTPTTVVRMAITFGVKDSAVKDIDTNMGVRNEIDRRAFDGKEKRSHKESAIAKSFIALQTAKPSAEDEGKWVLGKYNSKDTERFDRALDEECAEQFARLPYKAQFPASFWGALFWAYPMDPDAVEDFAHRVQTPANHVEGAPAALMREYMIQMQARGNAGGESSKLIQARALYLLRAHLQHRTLKKTYVPELGEIVAWFGERLLAGRRDSR